MMRYDFISSLTLILILLAAPAFGQGGVDADTLLLLRFENNLNGEQGETPTQNSGITYEAGILGQGIFIDSTDILRYATAGNFSASTGTIEFWVKPRWSGTDNLNRCFFCFGASPYANNSLVIEKDGGRFLGVTVNVPHGSTGTSVSDWAANQWHYVAYTWAFPGDVRIYVDGVQRFSRPAVAQDIVSTVPASLTIGSFNLMWQANAVIDELRVSSRPRTQQEISQRMINALTISSLDIQLTLSEMYPTWEKTPTLTAATNLGTMAIPPASASWTSLNPSVATVDANGKIYAVSGGSVAIRATVNGVSADKTIVVKNPVLPLTREPVPSYLATPADGYQYEVPVVIIRFLPTSDGTTLDTAHDPDFYTLNPVPLSVMKQRYDDEFRRVKYMLEEGSRFRGYSNPNSPPALGYRVVDIVTIYEPTPQGKAIPRNNLTENGSVEKGILEACGSCLRNESTLNSPNALPVYLPDYHSLMQRIGGQNMVENLGVKEFWIWHGAIEDSYPSYNPDIHLPEYLRFAWESNMASPITGDISNSDQDPNDLPVYSKTYTLYSAHSRRVGFGLMLHNMGHQVEYQLTYIEWLRHREINTGNPYWATDLFWKRFVGRISTNQFGLGRSGWTHMPPNTTTNYDYRTNYQLVPSDISAWQADSPGVQTPVNADTWGRFPYQWTGGARPILQEDLNEAQWYIYWRQSIPGRGNGIPFRGKTINNWWSFIGDWEGSVNRGLGLYGARSLFDFDGDGKSDIAVFRPSLKTWFISNSGNSSTVSSQFGLNDDFITPADYDGDGKTDVAVFRRSTGAWYLLQSTNGFTGVQFGQDGDIPVPADYDGDGKADITVFRPSNGVWYRLNSSNNQVLAFQFGISEDKPTIGDFDGDGKADLAVFRPSNGVWYRMNSSNGQFVPIQFGISEDKVAPADFDGDGKTDIAVFRPSNGTWYRLNSSNGAFISQQFGVAEDKPVAADFDGDGKADIAVFRPSNNVWYLLRSTAGLTGIQFGAIGDLAVPNAFIR